MNNTRLSDVLAGKEDNYLLPFYWQHGNHTERIPEQIERIRLSGCRALCVESRPHPKFCEDEWWRDMDIILSECRKRDMKVWILDDKHFPTGYANGAVARNPEYRAFELTQRHIDVMGPKPHASILMNESNPDDKVIGIYACKRTGDDENISGEVIDLTDNAKNGFLYFDIPEGCWRIFFLHKSHAGSREAYIDMVSPSSGRLMIENVYQPHYEHYSEYFGNTLAGFFSDEPEFGNWYSGQRKKEYNFYDTKVGNDGLALPWSDDVINMMTEELGRNPLSELPQLWYDGDTMPQIRLAYMNAVTKLYRDNFSRQIGDWCRAHGVEYIGHIIEDMNNHARTGHSAGHYFRALDGQDMSGIDIVLHQVNPGFGHYMSASTHAGSCADPEFFHYVLAQLACSLADLNPKMKNHAMCEVFGAYGWAEGTPMMKWLMDFLLVRGVYNFVPHAFSPDYPDPDCPPHFGAEGHDPQFDGFTALMDYTNKASHLLSGGKHSVDVALLYHAEGEWMNKHGSAMLDNVPAKILLDNHISFDIVWEDILDSAEVIDGKLVINGITLSAFVVPEGKYLPEYVIAKLNEFADKGLPVICIGSLPQGINGEKAEKSTQRQLISKLRKLGIGEIKVKGDNPLLRVFHTVRGSENIFMIFNESPERVQTKVTLPVSGEYAVMSLNFAENKIYRRTTSNGTIDIDFVPGQSEILLFGDENIASLPTEPCCGKFETINPEYSIEIAYSEDLNKFEFYRNTAELSDINAPENIPGFSGKIRYTFDITLPDKFENVSLDLGTVGENARLTVNGYDAGIRIASPYIFDITDYAKPGKNTLTVVVSNTLANKVRDWFSYHIAITPSGMLGEVKLAVK